MVKNSKKDKEPEVVETPIEDIGSELDDLFAEDFVPETPTRKTSEPKKLDESIVNQFVTKFRKVIPDGESKNISTTSMLKAFKLDTTMEKKDKESGDTETVDRVSLPPYVINSLEESNLNVEKIRGNPGYEITYVDTDNMEDLGEVESSDISEIEDDDVDSIEDDLTDLTE